MEFRIKRNTLIFLGGILAGSILTILIVFFIQHRSAPFPDAEITWFEEEKPVDQTNEYTRFEVFQVLEPGAALAEAYSFPGEIVLIINDENKYYYDNETVYVPTGHSVVQIGIFQYLTRQDFKKTVPVVKIVK